MNTATVRSVSKSFSPFTLKDVSFAVPQGYITGLIGPNGAGKSTIIKTLLGLIRPDGGSVEVFGSSIGKMEKEIKQRIGYVSDESHYYEHLTILEMKRILAPFYENWKEEAFRRYLDQFELPEKKKIKDLSKGMKMKFALAVSFAHDPDFLVMDEPTGGLDPVFRRDMLDLLTEFIQDERKTVLFSTHITTDLDRIADYIVFLNRGRLAVSDSKDELLGRYALVKGSRSLLDRDIRGGFVGLRETDIGFEGLVSDRKQAERLFGRDAVIERPGLEDILFYTVKGSGAHV
jgi:ABC-2 type transport system ATP-binding protein